MAQLEPARLKFLQTSADQLSLTSPSTAAYLRTVHNGILHNRSNSLTVKNRRDACPACGSIRVPGVTCKIFTARKSQSRTRSQRPGISTTPSTNVIYECTRCHHKTVIQKLQRSLRQESKKKRAPIDNSTPRTEPVSESNISPTQGIGGKPATPKDASDNTNSKRRAKSRKQTGLLASLATKKMQPSSAPSSTLDLFDFLQSS
ncbi:hypothetical protein FQN57_002532 [Myotisia sp. PD_48]|nr:hypothetical protein FQN57_002532 [Myotisia sp. PD_48]